MNSIQTSIFAALWNPEVMINMTVLSDVQISPDNQSVAFVTTTPKMDGEKGALLLQIYKANISDQKSTLLITDEFSSCQPRWSPDGKWIAYLSKRNDINNLYIIPSNGGEPKAITNENKSIQTFAWSPDSSQIAFVMTDSTEANKTLNKTSLAYDYMKKTEVNRLWLIDVFAVYSTPKPLTNDNYCVRGAGDFGTINCEFDWSPDSKNIVFAYQKNMGFDSFHIESSLAVINLASNQIKSFDKQSHYEAMPCYSPDGKTIAYLSNNTQKLYAINRRVSLRTSEGKYIKELPPSYNEGVFLGGPNLLGWMQDSKGIYLFEPKGTRYHIQMLPIDGSPIQELVTEEIFFKEPILSKDRSMLGFIIQSPNAAPEVFVSKVEKFDPQQISSVNQFMKSLPKFKTDIIRWNSNDGLEIEGLVTYPNNYEKGKAYPLLLCVHGGPMGFFDETFLGTPNPYPLSIFAEEGFVLFRPNPRGSTGYQQKFREANFDDWGGNDYLDIMSGIDFLVNKGIVDREKMGIMGWSYGGYMTSWIVSQTSQFKAASIGAGPCNLISMAGTTDLYHFLSDYMGDFVKNKEFYIQRSPLSHVSKITTPCLIQHGIDDKRVPVTQAYELYHAMNRLNKSVKLVLYPGMGHRLTDPKMQLDAMNENLKWFKIHLNNDKQFQ
jgi:dipeptidyl aminopeptidase/acylaminoacyl peptidase